MSWELYPHQRQAVNDLANGKILTGLPGSGKTLTSLVYYYERACKGVLSDFGSMRDPKDLIVITTARKRDSGDWQNDGVKLLLTPDRELSHNGVTMTVDSWNNIGKYRDVRNAFFIFDEQRLVGAGAWTKSFVHIAQANEWILLSATPGDTWLDYIPVFVANGFYKNRTEFKREHCIYNNYAKWPKVERYVGLNRLVRNRNSILVEMPFVSHTTKHFYDVMCDYDSSTYAKVVKERWHVYEQRPITDVAEMLSVMRRVVNSDSSRVDSLKKITQSSPRVIVFYNFDYELEILRELSSELPEGWSKAEWNGHKHEPVPDGDSWLYLVQYAAGAEAWNCIETDTVVFWSQNYSYKMYFQAQGRVDRLNTPYFDLHYYNLLTNATIDAAIRKALDSKKTFNESMFDWSNLDEPVRT